MHDHSTDIDYKILQEIPSIKYKGETTASVSAGEVEKATERPRNWQNISGNPKKGGENQ